MSLPIFQTDDKDISLLQTGWATQLNPVISNPLVNGQLLKNVSLSTGSNTINHKLGRKLQGWVLTRLRGSASLFDTQDSNANPALTLLITSSSNVSVDIYVF